MTLLDNVIGYFDPEEKLRRIHARMRTDVLAERQRAYDGASKGRRTDGWKATGLSSAAEIANALPTLRDRSRELVRNNAYACRGMQVIATNVVGKGIRPAIVVDGNDSLEDLIKTAWKDWAESTDCDFDAHHDFYGLQQLCIRSVAESGEVLVRRRRVRSENDMPLKLQVLESDFLATDHTLGLTPAGNGNQIIQGIEFDRRGVRVAYHIYETHPGNLGLDFNLGKSLFKTIRVPASDIQHIYRVDRPGQLRGTPWLTATMLRLKDFDDYEQAQLLRQKLAACYMAFIKDTEVPDFDEEAEKLLSKFEPGVIEFLPPGKDIVLSDPPQVNENYGDYTRVMLQAVATGLGVSYEALTGNLKDINFSSMRGGWLEFQRNIETWRNSIVNVQLNSPVWKWFEAAGELRGLPVSKSSVTWTAPRREMIDPAKEVPALVEAVANKMKTLSEVIRENGKNPEDHFKELAAEKALLDSLGISLETDNSSKKSTVAESVKND